MKSRYVLAVLLAMAVTALMMVWLVDREMLRALPDLLARIRWRLLLPVLVLIPLVHLARAARWRLMLTGMPGLPGWSLVRVSVLVLLFNLVLPMRLGEASFPLLMRRESGTGLVEATGILVLSRLIDLCVVAAILFAAACLVWPGGDWPLARQALLVGAPLALAASFAVVMAVDPIAGAVTRLLPRLTTSIDAMRLGAARIRDPRLLLWTVALSLAVWLLLALVGWTVAYAVAGFALPVTTLATAASNLAFALPVTGIAGLGPAQAAFATALAWTGAPWPEATLAALASHLVVLALAIVLGAPLLPGVLLRRTKVADSSATVHLSGRN